jgi:hypothetical protein
MSGWMNWASSVDLTVGPWFSAWIAIGTVAVVVAPTIVFLVVRRARRRSALLRAADIGFYTDILRQQAGSSVPRSQANYAQFVTDVYVRRTYGQVRRYKVIPSDRRKRRVDVQSGLFHTVMFFIPRQIRSPWLDHLLSDRERMIGEGRSRRFVATATAVQYLSLLLHFVFGRVWDLLTPFKSRS